MAQDQSTAHPALPSTEDHGQDHPHACADGVLYIGYLVEQDGEEVEVIEAVPCQRCAAVDR